MFRREERGQALVEFAIVLPALLLLILGIVEFAFVWNSRNTVLFASRDGAMLAAEGGNGFGTDCVVLDRIERDIISPSNAIRIQQVQLYWSDRNGDQIGAYTNVYDRSGSTTCDFGDGSTLTVPYTLSSPGYPEGTRCDVLAGCGGSHTSVDTIGVRVTYRHTWITSFARIAGGGTLGCSAGQSPNASTVDMNIVAAVERVLTGNGTRIKLSDVSQIRIWKATATGAETSGLVNVWNYQLNGGPTVDGQPLDFVQQSQPWQPCARNNVTPVDSIGVTVVYTYRAQTPLRFFMPYFNTIGIADHTVMALNVSR